MVLGRLEPEASPHWSQASSLSAEEIVVVYHERTKHHYHRFARQRPPIARHHARRRDGAFIGCGSCSTPPGLQRWPRNTPLLSDAHSDPCFQIKVRRGQSMVD